MDRIVTSTTMCPNRASENKDTPRVQKRGNPKEGKKILVYTNHRKTTTPERAITSSRPLPTQASGQRLECQLTRASTLSLRTQQDEALACSIKNGTYRSQNKTITHLRRGKTVTMLHYTARKSERTLHPLTNTARRRKRNQHSTTSYAN